MGRWLYTLHQLGLGSEDDRASLKLFEILLNVRYVFYQQHLMYSVANVCHHYLMHICYAI